MKSRLVGKADRSPLASMGESNAASSRKHTRSGRPDPNKSEGKVSMTWNELESQLTKGEATSSQKRLTQKPLQAAPSSRATPPNRASGIVVSNEKNAIHQYNTPSPVSQRIRAQILQVVSSKSPAQSGNRKAPSSVSLVIPEVPTSEHETNKSPVVAPGDTASRKPSPAVQKKALVLSQPKRAVSSTRKPSVAPSPLTKGKSPNLRDIDVSGVNNRRNLDKRTARLRYASAFLNDIIQLQRQPAGSYESFNNPTAFAGAQLHKTSVFVRKRPIFEDEVSNGDFDVVSIDSGAECGQVLVFRTGLEADMKKRSVHPILFNCTAAFGEAATSEDVYQRVGRPLFEDVVSNAGGIATLLMFGQTGAGKTYSMSAIEARLARDLFTSGEHLSVQVRCLEISGKRCVDLLQKLKPEVSLVESSDGRVDFKNSVFMMAQSQEQLSRILAHAKKRRSTKATLKNDVSSRSHAINQFIIESRNSHNGSSKWKKPGLLTLIDCAGSERRNDSLHHCQQRQLESTEINASLYALKECIRARNRARTSSAVLVPYRMSLLTRILRETFERKEARLSVFAAVAPTATDTEHTVQTLKTVLDMIA
jgi:kinesin family member 2/24